MGIVYYVTIDGGAMASAKAREVAELCLDRSATFTVGGTPDEQAEGLRRVEDARAEIGAERQQRRVEAERLRSGGEGRK